MVLLVVVVAVAVGVVSKEAAELVLVMVRVLLCWWTWCRCCCYWCCCWGWVVVAVAVAVAVVVLLLLLVEGELGAGGVAASAGAGGGLNDGGAEGFEGYCGQAGHRENRERVWGRWCCAMNVVFLVHPSEFLRAPARERDVSVVRVATWLFLVVQKQEDFGSVGRVRQGGRSGGEKSGGGARLGVPTPLPGAIGVRVCGGARKYCC